MPQHKYLIIGGGMTADSAVKGIRQIDQKGDIAVFGSDSHPPYKRPPLSKALWKGEPVESIWLKTPGDGVTMHLSETIRSIDPGMKIAVDEKGEVYTYNKLLLATGGVVRRLSGRDDGVIYYRTYDDYEKLRSAAKRDARIVVIGGGFIGTELAASLCMQGVRVTMIFPETTIGARVYPPGLSRFLTTYYTERGVEVLGGDGVSLVEREKDGYAVVTSSGKRISATAVVAGLGITPNIALAQQAGLHTSNGIDVNEQLQTSNPDIYSAGDVANFFNPALGKRIRVEHEDNATTMGEWAGKNMAGETTPYQYLPFFYSDLFDLGYEAIGELDARYQMVEQWKEEFREGVIYYLHGNRVHGVLLWNTWGQVDPARILIAGEGPFDERNVKGKLPV